MTIGPVAQGKSGQAYPTARMRVRVPPGPRREIMTTLLDPTEMLRCCELQRERMVERWREKGRFEHNGVATAALLIATKDPDGGRRLEAPIAIPCDPPRDLLPLIDPASYTELLAGALRACSEKWGGIGLIICAEAWMVKMVGPPGKPMTPDEAVRQRAELPKSLGDAPGRIEAMVMFMEHVAAGTHMWMAEITRKPTKLGPWKKAPADGFAGRFKGIVGSAS